VTTLSNSWETISNARVHGFGWETNSPQSYLEVEVQLAKLAVENGAGFRGIEEERRTLSSRTNEQESAILRGIKRFPR